MNKKAKLAFLSLLGFSAACSTVKNAPKENRSAAREETQDLSSDTVSVVPSIRVMYGVRRPIPLRTAGGAALSEMDPVVEETGPDSEEPVAQEPATTSGLDPVVEALGSDTAEPEEQEPATTSGLDPVVEEEPAD